MKRSRSNSRGRRSSIVLQDGTEVAMQPNIRIVSGSTAKFLEKTRKATEIVNEATNLAYIRIQTWIDYVNELKEQAKLSERKISTPISKPSNLMLDVDLLDLDGVIDQAFQKCSLMKSEKVAEARNEYTELERLRDDASKAEDELQELVEEKRHDLENDIQKIDEELADLEALCTALGCHQEFEAIVSTNGS